MTAGAAIAPGPTASTSTAAAITLANRIAAPTDSVAGARARTIFTTQLDLARQRVDRWFAVLMACQWLGGILIAWLVSPRTWSGTIPQVHPHLLAAAGLGGAVIALPLALVRWMPGQPLTRHVVAVAQMLTSALLIHLTGGRIETHFHVFGSLAFLAYYRDWRVLATASAVIAADHAVRGALWPESVYGVLAASGWRWVEHVVWVVFEDAFLLLAIRWVLREMRETAEHRAKLEVVASELARSNAQLEQFAYVSSHDLQEPLRMVSCYLGVVRQRGRDRLDEEMNSWIARAEDGAQRMGGLIKDLLTFSRAAGAERTATPYPVAEAVRVALDTLQSAVAESAAEIVVGDLPALRIATGPLIHVFQNLIGNAIKYRRGPPRLRIAAEARGAEWEFSVADDGIGIPPEHRERVFEMFQRLHRREDYPGTGIGLALCKRIVENHGGRIRAEETPGGGTTVRFTLPAG